MHIVLCRPPRESDEEDLPSEEPKISNETLSVSETLCVELAEEDSTQSVLISSQVGTQQDSTETVPKSSHFGVQQAQGGASARTEPLPKSRFLHRVKKVKVFQQTDNSVKNFCFI